MAYDFASIRLLVCDVDGVLTDGSVTYGQHGLELKAFNIKDGLAMKLAAWAGLPVVWLTGRTSEAVARRAAELEVEVVQGEGDKARGLQAIARAHAVPLSAIAYVGDDLNDLPALRCAGLPIAVADAAEEVRAVAGYVTRASGGHGAIREIIEAILHAQHRWDEAVDLYLERIREVHLGQ